MKIVINQIPTKTFASPVIQNTFFKIIFFFKKYKIKESKELKHIFKISKHSIFYYSMIFNRLVYNLFKIVLIKINESLNIESN